MLTNITLITIAMAPVYIERGLQKRFAETPEGQVAAEEAFNEWFADGGSAARIEMHVALSQTEKVKALLSAVQHAPQADVLELVFENVLAQYLFDYFRAGVSVDLNEQINVVEKAILGLMTKAA